MRERLGTDAQLVGGCLLGPMVLAALFALAELAYEFKPLRPLGFSDTMALRCVWILAGLSFGVLLGLWSRPAGVVAALTVALSLFLIFPALEMTSETPSRVGTKLLLSLLAGVPVFLGALLPAIWRRRKVGDGAALEP